MSATITTKDRHFKGILELTFDNIANVPVADESNISDWNTFFDLPTYGTPFNSIIIDSNTVKLYGGSGITFKSGLFCESSCKNNIIKVIDTGTIIELESTTIGSIVKSPFAYNDSDLEITNACNNLYEVSFQSVISIGIFVFGSCTSLVNISLPNLINVGIAAFYNCISIVNISLPNIINIPYNLFRLCSSLSSFIIPECITSIGASAFYDCPAILNIYMYPITAPSANDSFSATNKILHIRTGATGYNISPWTNIVIFSSIVQDL